MNTAPTVGSTAALAAVIVVILNAKRRRLLRRFRDVGAIDVDHAVTLQTLGMSLSRIFSRLVRRNVFVAVPDGRYYLDEVAASRFLHRKRIEALVVVGVMLLAFLVLSFSGMIR